MAQASTTHSTPASAATAAPPPYPQVPVLDMPVAAAVLVCNVIVPGVGTIVAAVVGKQKMIGRGIAQLLLSLIIVGWVWAIVTGVQCLINAKR